MPHITATATGQPQITATVGETKIDVAVGGGVGPSGVIAVSAPLVNSGAPSAASLSISVGDGLAVVDGELVADYTGPSFTAAVVSAAPPTIDASLLTQGTLSASRLPASGVAAGQYTSVTVDSYGRVTAGGNHSVAWSDLTGKPTTVAAAGLADAVVTGDSRLADAREWSASTVSQADAEAGISTSRFAFTPLRVFQAIAAWWAASSAKTKLDGIATGATANATDAQLRDRSTHTGSQLAATISDFASAVVAAAPPTTNASLLTSGTLPDARLSSNIARTSDVSSAVAAVVNAAPAALDTLNELAAALGNDASFATTVTNALAGKAPLASPTFTGTVSGITATMVGLGNVPNVDATARANHTGTQTASTISDFASAAVSAVTWTTLTGKPTFATVATSGAYSDLTGTPAAYSLPTASGSVLGGVKVGSGLSIDGSGVLTATYSYSLPVATASVLGGVKQGSNVTIGVDGTISVAAPVTSLPYSSITGTPTLATVATSGSAADLTGTLSASRLPSTSVTPGSYGSASAVATYTVDGTGRLTAAGSTSIAIAAGAVSGLASVATSGSASDLGSGTVPVARLPLATTGAAGSVIVGTGLAVSSGTVSVSYGTASGTACQGNDARLSDSRTPTGAAGGDLTGTYPNPQIAAGAVTEADLANAVRNQLLHPFLLAGM